MNEGTLNNTGTITGGIVGNDGYSTAISNCYNNATIDQCLGFTGGIVGSVSATGTVQNCYDNSTITTRAGNNDSVGGIAGKNVGQISYCYNKGAITAGRKFAGGIAGEASGTATAIPLVRFCYNEGIISGVDGRGGIIGQINGSIISDCYNIGTLAGSGAGGGLAGAVNASAASNGKVMNSYSSGSTVNGTVGFVTVTSGVPKGEFANLFYDSSKCSADNAKTAALALVPTDFASGKVAAMLNASHVGFDLVPSPAAVWSNDAIKPIFADAANYPVYQYDITCIGEGYTVYV